ncbi:MAG TPA: hypothetical protein ENG66_04060 [Thermococcus sp.]|nr:hypothetical protein [Thermococcus sp.]
MKIKFRPSSHSHYYTVVGIFSNEQIAREKAEKADLPQKGRKVFMVLSQATIAEVDSALQEMDELEPDKIEVYTTYQELEIKVEVPIGANLETLPLFLPASDVALLRALINLCGKPTKVANGIYEKWIFHYSGEKIFYCDSILDGKMRGDFVIGDGVYVPSSKIEVSVLEEL